MNHQNAHSIFKLLGWAFLCMGLFFSYCPSAKAITPVRQLHKNRPTTPTTPENQQHKKPVYLLDWQGDRLVTTAGVFTLNHEIEIIDQNNIKALFSSQQKKEQNSRKLHRIIIKKSGRKIVRITIK
jgi:hypothetical protein